MKSTDILLAALILTVPMPVSAQSPSPSGYQVPMPAGMPKLPPGTVVTAGNRPRRIIIQTAPSVQGSRARSQGSGQSEQGGTFEIYGNSSVKRFAVIGAPKPDYHTVRSGDTLWDICETYFQDPWLWPKIWALNPEITNPHWIYPGDRIRLRKGHAARHRKGPNRFGEVTFRTGQPTGDVWLSIYGFISEKRIKKSGVVRGAFSERIMLTTGDVIYIKVNKKQPLEVGKTYSIYNPIKVVKQPYTKLRIGRVVRLDADVEIDKVTWHGNTGIARGTILRAANPVERGYLVGPVHKKLTSVTIQENRKIRKLEAVVSAVLSEHEIIGARRIVFLDKGAEDGLRPGFVLDAYRRGDLYRKTMEADDKLGPHSWPAEVFGQVVIMRTGPHHSVAMVLRSRRELKVGTLLRLRYSGPTDQSTASARTTPAPQGGSTGK